MIDLTIQRIYLINNFIIGMILTHDEIIKEINFKRLKITPFELDAVGPGSVDLTLDHQLRIFINADRAVTATEKTDYTSVTKKITIKGRYTMKPGELVLGITKERIELPDDIAGWLNSRSRFARLGLMVHITAPFIQPGDSGRQVLEMYNAGPNDLNLIPGERLCQLILERCEGHYAYKGHFKNQEL